MRILYGNRQRRLTAFFRQPHIRALLQHILCRLGIAVLRRIHQHTAAVCRFHVRIRHTLRQRQIYIRPLLSQHHLHRFRRRPRAFLQHHCHNLRLAGRLCRFRRRFTVRRRAVRRVFAVDQNLHQRLIDIAGILVNQIRQRFQRRPFRRKRQQIAPFGGKRPQIAGGIAQNLDHIRLGGADILFQKISCPLGSLVQKRLGNIRPPGRHRFFKRRNHARIFQPRHIVRPVFTLELQNCIGVAAFVKQKLHDFKIAAVHGFIQQKRRFQIRLTAGRHRLKQRKIAFCRRRCQSGKTAPVGFIGIGALGNQITHDIFITRFHRLNQRQLAGLVRLIESAFAVPIGSQRFRLPAGKSKPGRPAGNRRHQHAARNQNFLIHCRNLLLPEYNIADILTPPRKTSITSAILTTKKAPVADASPP